MVSSETQIQKQCRIKTAGLGRYRKEYNSYVKEVAMDQEKIKKAEDEGKDQYFIKKLHEVLKETEAMVPILKEKIIDAITDLEMYLEEHQETPDLSDSELLEKAQIELKESHLFLENIEKEEEEEAVAVALAPEGDDDEEMPMDDDED
jgi:hypothetical protein